MVRPRVVVIASVANLCVRRNMARSKTPQSSADDDGDIEMADSSSTLNVPKKSRATKKLKTQKSSDALDVETTLPEPPRTRLVMVSVEGKRSELLLVEVVVMKIILIADVWQVLLSIE